MTIHNDEPIDERAFQEGWETWTRYIDGELAIKRPEMNPYEPETIQWYSWNKGWNENDYGL